MQIYPMVNVGVIGLGPDWETRFRPALRKLRDRIALRAFYDPVANRAEQVAAEWNAASVDGLNALATRSDVGALLLLDAGWAGWQTLELLCAAGKPVLIVDGLGCEADPLQRLHEQAMSLGQSLMPAYGLRYTPASSRLRELIATRLGPVKSLTLETPTLPNGETTSQFFACADWCRYVIGTPAVNVHAEPLNGRAISQETDTGHPVPIDFLPVKLQFAGLNSVSDVIPATMRQQAAPTLASPEEANAAGMSPFALRATVVCENGTATLESETGIAWQAEKETASESLTSERTETEVMLDLFCRRVAGGLIPIADVSDVLYGVRLLDAAQESRRRGEVVTIAHAG